MKKCVFQIYFQGVLVNSTPFITTTVLYCIYLF